MSRSFRSEVVRRSFLTSSYQHRVYGQLEEDGEVATDVGGPHCRKRVLHSYVPRNGPVRARTAHRSKGMRIRGTRQYTVDDKQAH